MAESKCTCGSTGNGSGCPVCRQMEFFDYWCEICGKGVLEKRCPACGTKTRKVPVT